VASALPPFWRNVRKRLTKTPKLHLVDSGLAAALLDLSDWKQAVDLNLAGALCETWVHQHLRSYVAASTRSVRLWSFRSAAGDECDFVIEAGRRLVPLEVKASQTPMPKDASGIRVFFDLFEAAPFGIVLHAGTEATPLAERVVALPLTAFLAGAHSGSGSFQ
jgi:predicted AAA+ superfamily ATPase